MKQLVVGATTSFVLLGCSPQHECENMREEMIAKFDAQIADMNITIEQAMKQLKSNALKLKNLNEIERKRKVLTNKQRQEKINTLIHSIELHKGIFSALQEKKKIDTSRAYFLTSYCTEDGELIYQGPNIALLTINT